MKEAGLEEWMMRQAIEAFDSKVTENGGIVNDIKYTRDLDLELQIKIDYLNDQFGQEATQIEIAKYQNTDGSFIKEFHTNEEVWNSVLTNLEKSKII